MPTSLVKRDSLVEQIHNYSFADVFDGLILMCVIFILLMCNFDVCNFDFTVAPFLQENIPLTKFLL